jgi:hypothetical protein
MTIPPVTYNDFVIYQGADFITTLGVLANNVAVDPTGWAITFTIKVNGTATSYLVNVSVGSGNITIDSTNKQFTVTLPGSLTNTLPAGKYLYNITTTDTGGKIVRRMEGNIRVDPKV